jgi:hypothetical protein
MLDQFFTNVDVAAKCLSTLDLTLFDTIVEPSCGNGSFYNLLPQAIGIEIDAKVACKDAIVMDFFDFSIGGKVLVVGNPPFGRVSNLAVKFFNHAATFADTIAFIVPATFRRRSVQDRLDLNFKLKINRVIAPKSFTPDMQARCVWQVWKRGGRRFVQKVHKSEDFWVVSPDMADIAIKAYGGTGDCGLIINPKDVINPKAYHFIALKNPSIKKRLAKLPYYPLAGWAVRQDSIGMKDIYQLYHMQYK